MSSINGSVAFIPAYQRVEKGHIDNDKPRQNPLDKTAGEDAEVFAGKNTGISAGNESRAHAIRNRLAQTLLASDEKPVDNSLVSAKRDAIDFEIKSDGNGGWVKA